MGASAPISREAISFSARAVANVNSILRTELSVASAVLSVAIPMTPSTVAHGTTTNHGVRAAPKS
jgi:hypothetical protein